MDGLRRGHYDAVVAYAPDRLHRSPRELEDFVDVIDLSGSQVATVAAGDWDLTTAEGRFTARLLGNVARMESEKKSDRIARKHLELAEAGRPSGGGRRPFGFEADKVTHRSDEADAIRDAAERVLTGESLRSIISGWAEHGISTVTGTPWSITALSQVLRSERVIGRRQHRGASYDAVWEPIIDADTAVAVRAVLHARGKGSIRRTSRSFLLSGIVTCGKCGHRMSGSTIKRKGKRIARYSCKADRGACGGVGIVAAPVDEIVTGAVLAALDTPALAAAAPTVNPAAPQNEIATLEARLNDAADMFAEGEIGRDEWVRVRDRIEAKLDAASAALAEVTVAASMPATAELLAGWDDIDLDARHRLIAQVIESVNIEPVGRGGGPGGGRFDPDRVSLVWKA